MTHYLVSAGIDTLRTMIIAAIVIAPFMAYPRTRRVIAATVKFTIRHSPRWAKPAVIAAQFFPGQLDDIVVFAVLVVPIMRHSRHRRAYWRIARMAWRGTF